MDYQLDKNPEVSFARGSCWSDGSIDLNTAFRKADNIMYANKREYYRQHPEYRRR